MYAYLFFRCPFNEKAVERAIYERIANVTNLPTAYCITRPTILVSQLDFKYSRENVTKINEKAVPCPSCNLPLIQFFFYSS